MLNLLKFERIFISHKMPRHGILIAICAGSCLMKLGTSADDTGGEGKIVKGGQTKQKTKKRHGCVFLNCSLLIITFTT